MVHRWFRRVAGGPGNDSAEDVRGVPQTAVPSGAAISGSIRVTA